VVQIYNPYTKAILGALIVFLGSLAAAFDDSVLTTTEILTAVGVGIAALGAIWAAHKMIKWLVGGLLAGLGSVALALQDDKFSTQEVITCASAVAVALAAIYATANTQASSNP
jgi:hypothetical protein